MKTTFNGTPKHTHKYKEGDFFTSTVNHHKHKISKDGKTALLGDTRHTHKLYIIHK